MSFRAGVVGKNSGAAWPPWPLPPPVKSMIEGTDVGTCPPVWIEGSTTPPEESLLRCSHLPIRLKWPPWQQASARAENRNPATSRPGIQAGHSPSLEGYQGPGKEGRAGQVQDCSSGFDLVEGRVLLVVYLHVVLTSVRNSRLNPSRCAIVSTTSKGQNGVAFT